MFLIVDDDTLFAARIVARHFWEFHDVCVKGLWLILTFYMVWEDKKGENKLSEKYDVGG